MTVSSQTLLFLSLSVAAALPSAPTTTRLHGQTARLHAQILRSRRAPGGASRNIPRLVRAANLPTANTTTLIRALVPEDQRLASHLLHASVAAGRVPRAAPFGCLNNVAAICSLAVATAAEALAEQRAVVSTEACVRIPLERP